MFDLRTYCDACDRLELGQEKLEEMIAMSEEKTVKKHLRRPARLLLAAAVAAALGITAGAAQLEAVQQLFTTVFVTVNPSYQEFSGLELPEVVVEKREGRTILSLNGEQTDVSDALSRDGLYTAEGENYTVTVDRDGAATVTARSGEGGMEVTYITGLEQGDVRYAPGGDGEEKVGSYTVVAGESNSISLTDQESGSWSYSGQNAQK